MKNARIYKVAEKSNNPAIQEALANLATLVCLLESDSVCNTNNFACEMDEFFTDKKMYYYLPGEDSFSTFVDWYKTAEDESWSIVMIKSTTETVIGNDGKVYPQMRPKPIIVVKPKVDKNNAQD